MMTERTKRQQLMPLSRTDIIIRNARLVNQQRQFDSCIEKISNNQKAGVRRQLFNKENYITSFAASTPAYRRKVCTLQSVF